MNDDRRLHRFSRAEVERRQAVARAAIDSLDLDVLVLQSRRDFHGGYARWLTDSPAFNPRALLVHRKGGLTVIEHGAIGLRRRPTDDRDHPGVEEIVTTAAIPSVHHTQRLDGEVAAELMRARGHRRIGLVAEDGMSAGFVAALRHAADGKATLVDATEPVDLAKAVKSPEEVAALEQVALLQDLVFAAVLAAARPGLRDSDLTALARHAAEAEGSTQALFLASSAPLGRPALLRPRHEQGRRIRPGDHLTLLIENNGPSGFYAELARTIVFGRATDELRDAFALVLEAQRETFRRLVVGASAAEIAKAHDTFMRTHGSQPEPRLYAHGHGYDIVERPLLRQDETMAVCDSMCFAVHPAHLDARLYVTVCDNVMVGPAGAPRRLHATEQRIFEL